MYCIVYRPKTPRFAPVHHHEPRVCNSFNILPGCCFFFSDHYHPYFQSLSYFHINWWNQPPSDTLNSTTYCPLVMSYFCYVHYVHVVPSTDFPKLSSLTACNTRWSSLENSCLLPAISSHCNNTLHPRLRLMSHNAKPPFQLSPLRFKFYCTKKKNLLPTWVLTTPWIHLNLPHQHAIL